MFFLPLCTVCHNQCEPQKIDSYFMKVEGMTITKACCLDCSKLTEEKWFLNGWERIEEKKK